MKKYPKYAGQKNAIVKHTKINMAVRKKLKVMISKLPIPEPLEKIILDFVGMKQFTF